jgi:hypothetical protein
MGERLRLRFGRPSSGRREPARRVLVRFLRDREDPHEPVGILNQEGFPIPEDGVLEVTVPETFLRVRCVSVHGGENTWGRFPLGKGNGAPMLVRVAAQNADLQVSWTK